MNYTLVWCIDENTRTMTFKVFLDYNKLVNFVYKDIGEDPVHIKQVANKLYYLDI